MKTGLQQDRRTELAQTFGDPNWYLRNRNYHIRTRIGVVKEFLKTSKFDEILDIGCGDGSISIPLLEKAAKLTLLDMSQGMLSVARSNVPTPLQDHVDFMKGDFMSASFEDKRFDLIVCLGVLAYIDSTGPFIAKINSILSPGGNLVVECTDSHHFMSRLLSAYGKLLNLFFRPKVRTCIHKSKEIIDRFREAGFTLTGTYRYNSPLPVFRRLFSQEFHSKLISVVHGNAGKNRAAWLGNECIFYFRKAR